MITEDQFKKLPKFAQAQIRKLEHDVEWYREQLRQVNEADGYITWELSADQERHGIPDRATITFLLEHGQVEITLRKGKLQVCATPSGRPATLPQASNVLEIDVVG